MDAFFVDSKNHLFIVFWACAFNVKLFSINFKKNKKKIKHNEQLFDMFNGNIFPSSTSITHFWNEIHSVYLIKKNIKCNKLLYFSLKYSIIIYYYLFIKMKFSKKVFQQNLILAFFSLFRFSSFCAIHHSSQYSFK